MRASTNRSVANIEPLAVSFGRHLRAANRSPRTVRTYLEAVQQLDAFLEERGMPRAVDAIAREYLEAYIEDQLARWKATTALARFKSLQQFFRWLTEEGEIPRSPMERMRPPKTSDRPVPILSPTEIRALLDACRGTEFVDRRDAAIIILFYDTGIRLAELVTLKLNPRDDEPGIDLDEQIVLVLGKGSRLRGVPIGAKTVKALDRYLRVRASHAFADSEWLWLGRAGKMGESGVQQMLRRRAKEAGLTGLNPHKFRHTFSHNWLVSGGQETDLMSLTGWKSRQMLERYGASQRAARARESHRKLSPADKL